MGTECSQTVVFRARSLERAAFVCAALALLAAPWFFGAWEIWWFWAFTLLLAVATSLFGLWLVLPNTEAAPGASLAGTPSSLSTRAWCVLSLLPFVAYAFCRFLGAQVYTDAERSFLLHLSSYVLGAMLLFGPSPRRRRLLFFLLAADLFLLAAYGIVNHRITGSRLVMWAEGFPQYYTHNRASGSYYCPNHFSGVAEIGFALGLSLFMTRRVSRLARTAGAILAGVCTVAVVMSQSRGGGLALIVICVAALVWGLSQWPRRQRWRLRAAALVLAGVTVIVFLRASAPYVERFATYLGDKSMWKRPVRELPALLAKAHAGTSRGRMYGGAIRAWKTAPWFGIGPGMHQNLWPHFAATDDGDRETGKWPSQLNDAFHSYEVHSDWLQLLEEYGIIGMALFLIPCCVVFAVLLRGIRRAAEPVGEPASHAILLAAILAIVALVFHSVGDFNLQMPATCWLLAALIGIALAETVPREADRS